MDGKTRDKKVIKSSEAPEAVVPYSQAVQIGNLMFTLGQLLIDPATGKIPKGPISIRAHQAIKNLSTVVVEAGVCLDDIVKTTVYLTDITDFQEANKVYAECSNHLIQREVPFRYPHCLSVQI